MWTYQSVAMLKNLLQKLEAFHSEMQAGFFSAYVTTLEYDYYKYKYEGKTTFGTLREILQSGHSVLLSFINDFKNNTFRTLVFADERNDAITLTVAEQNLYPFFGICVTPDIEMIELPEHMAVYIKRDPVIWIGSLQAIRRIRVNRREDTDSTGVSPFLFNALNMDIDGDTVIGFVVYDKFAVRDQQRELLRANTLGNKNRWSLETNHITSLFASMLRYSGYDLEKLTDLAKKHIHDVEQCTNRAFRPSSIAELPLYNVFEKILREANHAKIFGTFNATFERVRRMRLNFGDLINYMLIIVDDPLRLQQLIIENMRSTPAIGLDNAGTYYSVYNNIFFFVGISDNINLYVDFVDTYRELPDEDLSLLQPISAEQIAENQKKLNLYISTSHQLPRDSNTLTSLHHTSEFTTFENDTIYTAGHTILNNVSSVVPCEMVVAKARMLPIASVR